MRRIPLLFSMAALFVIAWTFQADAPTPADSPTADAATSLQRVYIDPATGQITSTPTDMPVVLDKRIMDGLNRSEEGLVEKGGPRGGKVVNLNGRFREAGVATVGTDGKLRIVYSDRVTQTVDSDQ